MGAKPGTMYKKFPKEHRDETADHVISTGRPVREVARELSMAGSALGDRVKRRRRELSGVSASSCARKGRLRPRPGRAPARP